MLSLKSAKCSAVTVLVFSCVSRTAERDSSSQDAVCVSVCMCVEIFFPTNPYLQAGLTDLDEIWHDGMS